MYCKYDTAWYSQCLQADSNTIITECGQCGGNNYAGSKVCAAGLKCNYIDASLSRCENEAKVTPPPTQQTSQEPTLPPTQSITPAQTTPATSIKKKITSKIILIYYCLKQQQVLFMYQKMDSVEELITKEAKFVIPD